MNSPRIFQSKDLTRSLRKGIEDLSRKTARPIDLLLNEAVRDYLAAAEYRTSHFKEAFDSGELATDEEVSAVARKWTQ